MSRLTWCGRLAHTQNKNWLSCFNFTLYVGETPTPRRRLFPLLAGAN